MGYIVAHHSLLTGDLTYLRHDGVVFLLYFYDVSEIDTAPSISIIWCGPAIRLQSNAIILTKANARRSGFGNWRRTKGLRSCSNKALGAIGYGMCKRCADALDET